MAEAGPSPNTTPDDWYIDVNDDEPPLWAETVTIRKNIAYRKS